MYIFKLALKSLLNRKLTTVLTILSIAFSVSLLISVERIRLTAKESFANTISQTDLIVGARGSPIQLLLYSVFRIGNATNNISWQSYQKFKNHPAVQWTIPYSLGDSHRGYRVVGTDDGFYESYRYHGSKAVRFAEGRKPEDLFDVVIGHEVGKTLHYKLAENLVLAHGISAQTLQKHEDKPFTVVGILEFTGTPIDRSLYITLEGIEAMHIDWQEGAPPIPGKEVSKAQLKAMKIPINQITAFLLRSKSRLDVLRLQRDINDFEEEAMMAIIPGVALSELWEGISYAEDALRLVSILVVIVGLMGMLIAIYNSLNERRRELAILRSIGGGPIVTFSLLIFEAFFLTLAGSILGVILMYSSFILFSEVIENKFGFYLPIAHLSVTEYVYLICVLAISVILGMIPAWRAYKNTLIDGLTIKL